MTFHRSEFDQLIAELEAAHAGSELPEVPAARNELHDFLVELRLRSGS